MNAPIQLRDYSRENCSAARTLALIGEKWTLLIFREAFFGVRRFDEMQQNIGLPRSVLTQRLEKLVEEGLFERVPYQEPGKRTQYEYKLTAKSLELLPALVALMQWGDAHLADPEGPPVLVHDKSSGLPVRVELVTSEGTVIPPRNLRSRVGPGAKRRAG